VNTTIEIVAHRGAPEQAIENTLPAFLHALELGADAVELDVRLTADHVPVVFHYFYLDHLSSYLRPIFLSTWQELRPIKLCRAETPAISGSISSLDEVLEILGGQIGLEIEIKGPEPASVDLVAACIKKHPDALDGLEITSYEPVLLERFQRLLPGVPVDLLIPLSEPWMERKDPSEVDVLAYLALQRGRLAGARAVHLHASQLSAGTVNFIRSGGCDVHAWGINDQKSLVSASELKISRWCTDNLPQALLFREELKQ
jgi:glycerophosphoryl diester phosphodiesterase